MLHATALRHVIPTCVMYTDNDFTRVESIYTNAVLPMTTNRKEPSSKDIIKQTPASETSVGLLVSAFSAALAAARASSSCCVMTFADVGLTHEVSRVTAS